MDPEEFKRRLDQTIDEIKSCRKLPGVDEILIPESVRIEKPGKIANEEFPLTIPRKRN